MSTFNMTKKSNSKLKDVTLALVLIGSLVGATLSTSVNAAPASSVQNAVSEFVVAQGQRMIIELNSQLQQSIENDINTFSTNFSLDNAAMWLTADQQVKKATPSMNKDVENQVNVKLANNTNINKIQTK